MDILRVKVNGVWTDIPAIQGDKGDTGKGIASAVLNADYTLTINFTDGTSYTTPSIRGANGVGVPTGGTTGQVLTKASDTDYDTEWTTVEAGGGTVTDVQVNGTSVVTDGVANVPIAQYQSGQASLGVVKVLGLGVQIDNTTGEISIKSASDNQIKGGRGDTAPVVSSKQHQSVFYGLAKAAGDSTQSASSNPVGTYTDEAKAAIQQMLDVPSNDDIPDVPVQDVQVNGVSVLTDGVANVPKAASGSGQALGVVMANTSYGTSINSAGAVILAKATDADLKSGIGQYRPVTPSGQHLSAFYGFAKAAGDTTQSQSSNAVGSYTENAKSKISDMLNGSVSVSGTTPTITALSGIQYVCGEVSTLDITLPASGIVDVVFESGSTPTVLTITPPTGMTMEWANGFDSTALEADTLYELNIKMVGTKCLGVAGQWS